MTRVDPSLLKIPPAELASNTEPALAYEAYLAGFGLLGKGFVFREAVRSGSPRHVLPPVRLWHRFVASFALANELRARMVAEGARGLRVNAAYRPQGGEADSQHRYNAALDLDLLPGDAGGPMGKVFARVAAQLWREHEDLEVGLGTYAPDGALWSNRVHIDTGYRFRCWQGTGRDPKTKRYTWAGRPAALILAPPEGSDLDDLSAVADGRVPPSRVLDVIAGGGS